MLEFKVWTVGWNGPENPDIVFSFDAERAAKEFVRGNYHHLDYSDEEHVIVVAPDGTRTEWDVTVETVRAFSAKMKVIR